MADLKDAVKHKLFGGKVKFRSDMEENTAEENKDTVEETPSETVEEKETE